jgi:hypothetical protein
MTARPRCPIHQTILLPAVLWKELEDGTEFPAPIWVCSHAECLQTWDGMRFTELDELEVIGKPLTSAIQRMKFLGR